MKVTAEKLWWSTRLNAVEVEPYKRLKELTIVRSARGRVRELVRSIVGQFVKTRRCVHQSGWNSVVGPY